MTLKPMNILESYLNCKLQNNMVSKFQNFKQINSYITKNKKI